MSTKGRPLPNDAEEGIQNFAELMATVMANAESRAELGASRARAVAVGDEARRCIQRDLHDGAQQSLVSTIVALKQCGQARTRASHAHIAVILDDA